MSIAINTKKTAAKQPSNVSRADTQLSTITDNRSATIVQRKLSDALSTSPRAQQAAQRQGFIITSKAPVQRTADEEEVQMKAAPIQRTADEEEVQMKATPIQRAADEEARVDAPLVKAPEITDGDQPGVPKERKNKEPKTESEFIQRLKTLSGQN